MTQDEKEDDFDLFRKEMNGIKPITTKNQVTDQTPKPKAVPRSRLSDNLDVVESMMSSVENEIESGDEISYLRNGYQKRVLQKLKRRQYSIGAETDLHGMTIDRARQECAAFLKEARYQHRHCVLIVHGKGRSSEQGKPILKNWINGWLRQRNEVIAFCSAHISDGGTGAVYVLLK